MVGLSTDRSRDAFGIAASSSGSATRSCRSIHVPRRSMARSATSGWRDVPDETPIDVVDCFVNAQRVGDVVDDAIAERDRLGIKAVWMQLGSDRRGSCRAGERGGTRRRDGPLPGDRGPAARHLGALASSCQDADMDLTSFKALSFDCYGTLIDWEAGSPRCCDRGPTRSASMPATSSCCSAYATTSPRSSASSPARCIRRCSRRRSSGWVMACADPVSDEWADATGRVGARLAGVP